MLALTEEGFAGGLCRLSPAAAWLSGTHRGFGG